MPETRLPELVRRLNLVGKQSKKLGVPPIAHLLTGRVEHRVVKRTRDALGRVIVHSVRFVEVEILGEVPRLPGGWRLVAIINHEEGMPIVKRVPGVDGAFVHYVGIGLLERNRGPLCDHCKTKRTRSDTFVLQAEDGRVVQVGRKCLADFLGIAAYKPDALLAMVAFLKDPFRDLGEFDWEDGDYSSRGRALISVMDVCVIAGAVIHADGWVSRARAEAACGRVVATAVTVAWILYPPSNLSDSDREAVEKYKLHMTPVLDAEAAAAIEWAKGHLDHQNEYLANLAVCATRDVVGADKLGLVVSLIAAYRREQDSLRVQERQMHTSGYVGTVGQRMQIDLVLAGPPRSIQNDYGTKYRCEYHDAEGHVLVAWSSNDPSHGGLEGGWQPGATRTVKATVKKHEEFRGIKTTTLSRVAESRPKTIQ